MAGPRLGRIADPVTPHDYAVLGWYAVCGVIAILAVAIYFDYR
jgi:hypothetical protein